MEELTSGAKLERCDEIGNNIFEAKLNFRNVVVKEIRDKVKALNEIKAYSLTSGGKNIVTMYTYFQHQATVELVLEKAHCSLVELINKCQWHQEPCVMSTTKRDYMDGLTRITLGGVGKPSRFFLGIIRDIIYGVETLEKKGVVHGCLKPESVMIFDDYEAKLLMNRHPKLDSKNINVDRFGLGEIIHFCATFGEYTKMVRGKTSLFKSLSPDVFHLINSLFSVPKAVIVHSNHITFWSSVKKMNFCCEANNKMFDVPFAQILALEINKKIIHGGNESWKLTIDNKTSELWDVVTFEGGNLNDTWTRDLIRFIRNAYQHRDGEKIKELIGKTPTEFDKFFSSLFPHLFVRIYEVASFYWLNDEVFRRFLLCDFYT